MPLVVVNAFLINIVIVTSTNAALPHIYVTPWRSSATAPYVIIHLANSQYSGCCSSSALPLASGSSATTASSSGGVFALTSAPQATIASSSGGISPLPSASPPKVTSSLTTFAQSANTAHMPLSSTPVIDDVLYGKSWKFPVANCSLSVMHCNLWGLLGNFKKDTR